MTNPAALKNQPYGNFVCPVHRFRGPTIKKRPHSWQPLLKRRLGVQGLKTLEFS